MSSLRTQIQTINTWFGKFAEILDDRRFSLSFIINIFVYLYYLSLTYNFLNVDFLLRLSLGLMVVYLVNKLMESIKYYLGVPIVLNPAMAAIFMQSPSTSKIAWQVDESWQSAAIFLSLSILLGVIIWSPIMALTMMWGLGVGVLLHLPMMTASISMSIIIVLIVTVAAHLPSRSTFFWAAFAAILFAYFEPTQDPNNKANFVAMLDIKTLFAFNVSLTLGIYGNLWTAKNARFFPWKLKPEDKLDMLASQGARFCVGEARLSCPFYGRWVVYQAFNGPWTHKGRWKHALDFVIKDEHGKSYSGTGIDLGDYYAFGQAILSPVSGYVVGMADFFADNPIGSVDNFNKWGNYLIIRDIYGALVVIAHLQNKSLTPHLYQYVEQGQLVARCGNSGYSPEPHIHIHVQALPYLGSPTIPFHVLNVMLENDLAENDLAENDLTPNYVFHGRLQCHDIVVNSPLNENLLRCMSFVLGDQWAISREGAGTLQSMSILNLLDPLSGTMFLTDGNAKLYHYRQGSTFCFSHYEGSKESLLFDLFTSLPRLPMIIGKKCVFKDQVSLKHLASLRWKTYLNQLFLGTSKVPTASYIINLQTLEVNGEVPVGDMMIKTYCKIDPVDGICEFAVGARRYTVVAKRQTNHQQRLEDSREFLGPLLQY